MSSKAVSITLGVICVILLVALGRVMYNAKQEVIEAEQRLDAVQKEIRAIEQHTRRQLQQRIQEIQNQPPPQRQIPKPVFRPKDYR